MNKEVFSSDALTLEVWDESNAVHVLWRGKSTARKPGLFVQPILIRALERASSLEKALTIDFREVEYMNSSTITPIIRLLERARRDGIGVRVLYRRNLKWQELSFSALEVFHSADDRIEIRGM